MPRRHLDPSVGMKRSPSCFWKEGIRIVPRRTSDPRRMSARGKTRNSQRCISGEGRFGGFMFYVGVYPNNLRNFNIMKLFHHK